MLCAVLSVGYLVCNALYSVPGSCVRCAEFRFQCDVCCFLCTLFAGLGGVWCELQCDVRCSVCSGSSVTQEQEIRTYQ